MTGTMLAITQPAYGGTEVLDLQRLPHPEPGAGEVLLRVRAAGIDRGTWHVLTGLPRIARLALGLRRPRAGVPGLDVAGTVLAVGPGVTRLAAGQEVFGIAAGSLAELAVARERKLALAPSGLTPVEAAVLGISGLTALDALDAGRVADGHRVLILGASGGVGSLAVKLAAARGARVTAVLPRAGGALTVLYDGRPDALSNWFETTGIETWDGARLVPADGPPISSPYGDGAWRYASAVPLPDGRVRFYVEAARPDGAHDLVTLVR